LLESYLEKLKKSGLNGRQMTFVNVLESNLKDLISSFTQKLSSKLYNLTPAELQVANFIKHGKNTKEIASFLHLSPKTIKNHRSNIRKKLDLTKKRVNLRSYLLSLG
jgi:DNA-binding NarL/FixJ family response regulator